MASPNVAPLVIGGLVIWSIFRRIRRNIGRQKLRPVRIIISIVIFTLVSLLFLFISLGKMPMLAGIGGGLLFGFALGFLGLRLTRFETTEAGHFYTPNTHIGIALSVVLAGRILYGYWLRSNTAVTPGQPPPLPGPLTLSLFGLVAGYYLVYYIGLFVHTHDRKPDAVVPPPLPPLA